MLISKYAGDKRFLWYSLSKWSLKLYFMNKTLSIDAKPSSLFQRFFSTPFSIECAVKVMSLYWMTIMTDTEVFYKKKTVLILCLFECLLIAAYFKSPLKISILFSCSSNEYSIFKFESRKIVSLWVYFLCSML